LIAIIGPTGVGKNRLALYLAPKLKAEIVNADSRQIYRFMDIGTAKPTREELASVPHHLYDIINPDQDFSLAQYKVLVGKSIHDIQERNKIPLLVGGSGQYLWAVLEGWEIPHIPPDPELRQKLETIAVEKGVNELYMQLEQIDPVAARKIEKHNMRRIIRALEVYSQAGVPFSELRRKKAPDYQTIIIGLTAARKELYRRVDDRVDEMIRLGLITEVAKLKRMGYDFHLPSLHSIGYNQIGRLLRGELSQEEAIRQFKTDNHRFVRHQYAWFRLKDKRIHWFDVDSEIKIEVMTLVVNLL
jgi:tRNA dimethylallyltransferase